MSRRVGLRTIQSGGRKPIPVGVLYVGFIGYAAGADYVAGMKIVVATSAMTNINMASSTSGVAHYFIGKSGNYLYFIGGDAVTNVGIVSKVNATTLAVEATLTFAAGEILPQSGLIVGNFLYVGLSISPAKIVKINLTTFAKVATLTFNVGENWILLPRSMIVSGGFLYASCYNTTPGKIVKVDLSTFTEVATLTLAAGENNPVELAVIGTNLYVGLDLFPGAITKIDLGSFTETSTLTLPVGENEPWLLITDGTNLYVILYLSPVQIAKINPATFTQTGVLTFSGVDEITPAGDDIVGTTLYVMCDPISITRPLVKVDLGTFTETGRINVNSQHSGNDPRCLFAL